MKRAIVSKIALLIQSGGQSQVDLKLGLVVEEVFEDPSSPGPDNR